MDCNKEEAIRAKVIAEKKMENKDFAGARKVATKAQNLHPELENIGQIICVCDVHCSAESMKLVNDKDWYSILQVEQSADEVMIKKQYRKFALLLHPDKNKFPGAEAAFKLVGEASRVLLDKEKRSFYDSKYRRFCHNMTPNNPFQPNKNPNVVKQPWGQANMYNASSHVKFPPTHEASSKIPNGSETTSCRFCSHQFYYKDGSNTIRCQRCKQAVAPVNTSAHAPPGGNPNQTATYTRVDFSNQGVKISSSNGRYQGNSGPPMQGAMPFATTGQKKEVGGSKRVNDNRNASKMNTGSFSAANPVKTDTGKKGKKRVIQEVSSDSFDSDSSTDDEQYAEVEKKSNGSTNQRRSERNRTRVSYNENGSDDDEIMKVNSAAGIGKDEFKKARVKDKVKENEDSENGFESDDSDSKDEPQTFDVPDPEFSDFDRLRKETPLKAGQVWACYDDREGMPRFYAEIKRVLARGESLKIYWFEADPDEADVHLWLEKKLPYACGKFCYGNMDNIGVPMLSHLMFPKLPKKVPLNIYPRNNETWALFRDWSPDWISKPGDGDGAGAETQLKYEYQFVEVLTDFDETVGIRVVLLNKLRGFICVFCRKGGDSEVQIPPNELLRFSHRVPSCRIEGKEMEGVPYGSFELDPASLPESLLSKS